MYKQTLCFIRRNDEILMLNRENKPTQGLWNGVGGKMQSEEMPKECVIREVKEETNIDIRNYYLINKGIITWEVDNSYVGGLYVYLVEIEDDYDYQTPKGIIVFRLKDSNKPLLVIASGANQIDEKQIEKHLDDKLGKANADFVREHTGYVIGGVPPLGHTEPIQTYIDEDIFRFKDIWAAAGHPKAVIQLTPDELIEMTEGTVVTVK